MFKVVKRKTCFSNCIEHSLVATQDLKLKNKNNVLKINMENYIFQQ